MSRVVEEIRKELIRNADEKTKKSGEHFFKEEVIMHGVKSALTSSIGKEHFNKLSDKKKYTIFSYCDELWKSGIMEETFIACNWSYNVRKEFKPEDFEILGNWVGNYVTNWASCDTLCNHTVGAFIEMYPEFLQELKTWAISEYRWMRRASAVSLIVPGRHGKFLKEIFQISDLLLTDTDDMVRKGYGWMLKVASVSHQKEVFEYVMKNRSDMPRTALRYSIEKMPVELRKMAMEKTK